jgi:hypothetical protein
MAARPTIRDIARAAGVHHGTVSRVLDHHPGLLARGAYGSVDDPFTHQERRRRMMIRARWILGRALLMLLMTAPWSMACSVPVFRYALERWPPSDYELWLFHQGPLSEAQRRLADELDREVLLGGAQTNIHIQWADVSGALSPEAAKAWAGQQASGFPHATLLFPPHGSASGIAHAGPADAGVLRALLHSPRRQEVVERLLGGDSAVWLFIESGDPAIDRPAFERLSATLEQMAQELEPPEPDPTDDDVRLADGGTPLKISFPVLRISRSDAAEQGLVALLTAAFTPTPPAARPFTVAISGQGRAIAMLSGDEIDSGGIIAWCEFIAGPCSCQVKAELPGSDLLMRADWSQLKDGRWVEGPEVPNVAVVNDLAGAAKPPTKSTPSPSHAASAPAAVPATTAADPVSGGLTLLIAAAAVLLAGASAWLILRRHGN